MTLSVDGGAGGEVAASNTSAYPQASLYVGDLARDVGENELFELFSKIGPVMSIRICRDTVSKASLGYGYVNYGSPTHAAKALEELNCHALKGRPLRLMWSQRDPAVRRSGAGNIFIKNLAKDVDAKALNDTFGSFGTILSAKVATDERGESKGFAFVHFQAESAAKEAIAKVNGKMMAGKKVFVGPHLSRAARAAASPTAAPPPFTNVFIKNLNKEETTAETLRAEVEQFGEVKSFVLVTDQGSQTSKGFAFVAYARAEEAAAAVDGLNGKELHSHKLYAGRAMKAEERRAAMRAAVAAKREATQGLNLYVKNLEEGLDEERFRREFAGFGTITSARLMRDSDGRFKGFGFVCYATAEEATKAVTEMNGRILGGMSKPLYVALAQRKEDRMRELSTSFAARKRIGRGGGGMGAAAAAAAQAPTLPNNAAFPGNVNYGYPPSQPNFLPSARLPRGPPAYANPQSFPNAPSRYAYPPSYRSVPANARPAPAYSPTFHQPTATRLIQGSRWNQVAPTYNLHFNQGARNRPDNLYPTPTPATIPNKAAATPATANTTGGAGGGGGGAATGAAAAAEQKQFLGEELYARVATIVDGTSAGKVTGMLLEMPNPEIVAMLHQDSQLHNKVTEAMAVLQESAFKHQ